MVRFRLKNKSNTIGYHLVLLKYKKQRNVIDKK